MMSPSAKDIVLTRRLAHLGTSSTLRIVEGARPPRALTKAEIHAAAKTLAALTEAVRRAAVAAGET